MRYENGGGRRTLEGRCLTSRRISRVQPCRQFVGTAVARGSLRQRSPMETNKYVTSFAPPPRATVLPAGSNPAAWPGPHISAISPERTCVAPCRETARRHGSQAYGDRCARSVSQVNEAPFRQGKHGGFLTLGILGGPTSTANEESADDRALHVLRASVIGDRLFNLRTDPDRHECCPRNPIGDPGSANTSDSGTQPMPGRKSCEAITGGSRFQFRNRAANAAAADGMIHFDRGSRDRFHEVADERRVRRHSGDSRTPPHENPGRASLCCASSRKW